MIHLRGLRRWLFQVLAAGKRPSCNGTMFSSSFLISHVVNNSSYLSLGVREFLANEVPSSSYHWRDLTRIHLHQERMSRGMQLHYIPVAAFSWTDLYLDRNSLE